MHYAICTAPAAPVRKEPSHKTEMVNQLLFGETIQVLEMEGEWFRIRSLYDGYEGWLTYHLIEEVDEAVARKDLTHVAISLLNAVMCEGQLIHIPMGCHLTGLDITNNRLWKHEWKYLGGIKRTDGIFDNNSIEMLAKDWIGAPYLWGGKTIFGVDCSGFVQTVFKIFGIKLLRDAYQQAEQGVIVEDLSKIKMGDLAFFQNENGRIIHVGIVLDKQQIIHASGKVRVDTLDEKGIVATENGKRTHQLHSIKRYF